PQSEASFCEPLFSTGGSRLRRRWPKPPEAPIRAPPAALHPAQRPATPRPPCPHCPPVLRKRRRPPQAGPLLLTPRAATRPSRVQNAGKPRGPIDAAVAAFIQGRRENGASRPRPASTERKLRI